jgi:phage protein D
MGEPRSSVLAHARPSIEIDGQRDATLTSAMYTLEVVDSTDGLARCDVTFGNWGGPEHGGFQHFGRDTLEFGKSLRITVGSGVIFDGRITAITAEFPEGAPPRVGVCAEDRLQDLRMTRRTRAFTDASIDSVLQQIASDHGLQPDVSVGGETYKALAQVNQSDLAFIRDLARREDAQVWVEGTTLKAAKRASRQAGRVDLSWAGQLRQFSVSADLAHQRTKLVGAGWNVETKSSSRHEADEAAISGEVGGGASGAATLRQAFGERTDTLAHAVPASDAQAQAVAESSFRHLARRFVTGYGVAETTAELRVGAKLDVRGVGPLFEGEYTITDIAVRFDGRSGLRTEFLCDRPAIGQG